MNEIRANGWRYMVQREQIRGDGVLYSLLVAPPGMAMGYLSGEQATHALRPVDSNHDCTKRGVQRVIRLHMDHTDRQQVAR